MARKKSAGSIIVLQDSVGIEQASSIKKQFADSIKKNKTTFVDISKITDIDSSIIQLILAAKKEADFTILLVKSASSIRGWQVVFGICVVLSGFSGLP